MNELQVVFYIVFCAVQWIAAQHAPPAPKPNGPPPPYGLPIDGGVMWLFFLGCIVGVVAHKLKPERQ